MPAYKDKAKGTWYASFYFENWTGKKEKKMKRGFKTKREALEWERTFLQQQTADLDMTFWAECTRMTREEIEDSVKDARELAEVFSTIAGILESLLPGGDGDAG